MLNGHWEFTNQLETSYDNTRFSDRRIRARITKNAYPHQIRFLEVEIILFYFLPIVILLFFSRAIQLMEGRATTTLFAQSNNYIKYHLFY